MDLQLLAQLLPDNVKRNILARVSPGNDVAQDIPHVQHAAFPPRAAAAQQEALAAQISTRQVQLPLLTAGACILDGILSQQEVQEITAASDNWLQHHGRRPGMGSNSSSGLWHDSSYRGDIHCWANPQELQAARQPLLAAVLQLLASLRKSLAAQGYDVAGRCSFQLVCYPGKGARYVRHTDASASAPDRTVTALLYLNSDWNAQVDGGELALYNASHANSIYALQPAGTGSSSSSSSLHITQAEKASASAAGASRDDVSSQATAGFAAGEPALVVAPLGGRLLVFDSMLPHEVLPANRPRFSITCWFYRGQSSQPGLPATQATTDPASAAVLANQSVTAGAAEPVAAGKPLTAPPAAANTQAATASVGHVPEEIEVAAAASLAHAARSAHSAVTLAEAAATHMPASGLLTSVPFGPVARVPRIFVSIAAFRDEECQWTLRDLFVKAAHPERVFVGVVWQVDPVADQAFVRMAGAARASEYQSQVREVRLHYSSATGPCAARSLAQRLWAGEEYVLQIDAHMRFVQDWDIKCLSELEAAQLASGSQSVVLSTYPVGYDGQGSAAAVPEGAPTTLLCAKGFDDTGLLRVQSRCLKVHPAGPLPSHFWAAGFSFAPAAWMLEVPYCPHLPHLFFGEEQFMLLRMWTRGWQVWAPSQPLLFHQWERSIRPNRFQACIKVDAAARAASQYRVLQLTQQAAPAGDAPDAGPAEHNRVAQSTTSGAHAQSCPMLWHAAQAANEADWALGGVWGLGTLRTLQEFEQAAGVSFQSRTVEPRALYGGQPEEMFER